MKLREVFSPTPSHTTLLIRVDNNLLYVCSQEEHGRQWERFVVKRRMTLHLCFHSIYRFPSLSVFCLVLIRSLSSVFSVFGSLSLSFYLSYIQSIALNPHPYSVSAVHDLLLQRVVVSVTSLKIFSDFVDPSAPTLSKVIDM